MAEFGGALDRWLEAPYVDAARREAEFEEWCTANGVDPEDDNAEDRFADVMGAIEAAAEAELARFGEEPEEDPTDWPEGCRCTLDSDGVRTHHGCPHHSLAKNTRRLLR